MSNVAAKTAPLGRDGFLARIKSLRFIFFLFYHERGQSPLMHVQPDKGLLFPGPMSAAWMQAAALGTPCREQATDLLLVQGEF